MTRENEPLLLDERTQKAIDELQNRIAERYPAATFEVARAVDDPDSVHLITVVDVDDPDEVGDLVIDRVVELQAEEQIPIHVIPIRTPERIQPELHSEPTTQRQRKRRTVPLLGRIPLDSQ